MFAGSSESGRQPEAPGLTRLSVPVPEDLAATFGYPGKCQFVAFYWTPVGDELCFDDGRHSGTADWYPFKLYRQHPMVAPAIAEFNFGYSDFEADDWLVIDGKLNHAFAADAERAAQFLIQQHPPLPHSDPAKAEQSIHLFNELMRQHLQKLPGWHKADVVMEMMETQSRAVERMLRFLDQWSPDP